MKIFRRILRACARILPHVPYYCRPGSPAALPPCRPGLGRGTTQQQCIHAATQACSSSRRRAFDSQSMAYCPFSHFCCRRIGLSIAAASSRARVRAALCGHSHCPGYLPAAVARRSGAGSMVTGLRRQGPRTPRGRNEGPESPATAPACDTRMSKEMKAEGDARRERMTHVYVCHKPAQVSPAPEPLLRIGVR
eukprot:COSAG01_NODE_320_length_18904_cov_45.662537_16_plen_193_part_00